MALTIDPTNALEVQVLGTISLAGAEITGYDPVSQRLFVTSSVGLQIIDFSDPSAPSLLATIDFVALGALSNNISSVAVKNGVVAVSLINDSKWLPGQVALIDAASGALISIVTVGANPDMVTFTPDGSKILVANEGELDVSGENAEGSVSIINLAAGLTSPGVTTATFQAFNGQEDALRLDGVRIAAGVSAAQDLEPEYIAISPDGATALVTLQENNSLAILDIATGVFTAIVPLGFKDFSGLLADFSDRDGPGGAAAINLGTGNPVFGLYMPDAISAYAVAGQTFYVIANEGDDRNDFLPAEETARVGDLDLDNAVFGSSEATLLQDSELGRLTVFAADSDADGDGAAEQLITLGARSFSIVDSNGVIIFDSADILERIVADIGAPDFDDSRSDNKGPEPEGVVIGVIGDRTYAFVGLERSNSTVAFDITNPAAVTYTTYIANAGDISPEGLLFIPAADSGTGSDILVVSNEVSGTVTAFEIGTPVDFTLQLLHFSDGEAGLLASQTAPLLAALVEGFEDDYANTIILAGGDNYLPGPFLAAATDPSVGAVTGRGTNDGAADIEIHNAIGVQASTVGNHEFDLGPNSFFQAVDDTTFPYLSANLDFSGEPTRLLNGVDRFLDTTLTPGLDDAATLAKRIVPSAVINQGGEQIGLVGATTQILERISSTGGVEVEGFAGDGAEVDDMALLAAQLQPVIDDLRAQGVNKIILMAHLQQIANEIELAGLLEGVDIILAAGSNTRLGDENDQAVAFPGHAADFANTYPIVATGKDGGKTLIVNTDNEYTYLGRLVVDFDADGNILVDQLDTTVNGAYAATVDNVAAAWNIDPATVDSIDDLASTAFAEGTKGERVKEITDAVQSVIGAKDGTTFGFTNVYLEGERALVRNQETNLGNLSADANAAALSNALGATAEGSFIVSLKNGGGIRSVIGAVDPVTGEKLPPLANDAVGKLSGEISLLDIENSLRFNNRLMAFDTTAEGLKAILEHGVAALGTQGRFPQIGGVSFSYDPDLAAGSRVQSVALIDENGLVIARLVENGVVLDGAPSKIMVVTLNFLAQGGDSYPIKANGENFRFLLNDGTISAPVDETLDFTNSSVVPANALGEQQAFSEYVAENFATPETAYNDADTGISGDTRIQNLNFRDDTVLLGEPVLGTDGADTLIGTDDADNFDALAGNDVVRGRDGDDVIQGGAGRDRLFGGDDDDLLFGGKGNDDVRGEDGNDVLFGDGGDDDLRGDDGDDVLDGGAGRDRVFGGDGDDVLRGGDGDDYLAGERGNDILFGDAGDDRLIGGSGIDTADYSESSGSVRVSLDVNGRQNTGSAGRDQFDSIENLIGGDFDDRLTGSSVANEIVGGAGDDDIFGLRGNDILTGGDGDDTFHFTTPISATQNVDVITDFTIGEDLIALLRQSFQNVGASGTLNADSFTIGATAADASDRVIYDQATGDLFFDRDGTGQISQVKFAHLSAGLALSNADFIVI